MDQRHRTLTSARVADDAGANTWSIEGNVGSIRIGDVADQWTLSINSDLASLTAGLLSDAAIEVSGQIRYLRADQITGGSITADSIGTLRVAGNSRKNRLGNCTADLTLDGTAVPGGRPTLRYAYVRNLASGTWDVTGDAGTLYFGTTAPTAFAASFTGDVRTLRTRGNLSGGFTARSVRTVYSSGSITDFFLTLTQGVADRVYALRTLTARNFIDGTTILSSGNIGTITAGAIRNSAIFAGVGDTEDGNADNVLDLPEPTTDLAPQASLTRLSISGRAMDQDGHSFVNSNIAAYAMGTISLRNAQTDNPGEPFGLAAHSIRTFNYRDATTRHTERDPDASWHTDDLWMRIA